MKSDVFGALTLLAENLQKTVSEDDKVQELLVSMALCAVTPGKDVRGLFV